MYTFLKELQNEQDDAEVSLAKLALSGKVKASLTEKWLEVYTSAHLLNCPQEGKGSIYRIQLPDRPFTWQTFYPNFFPQIHLPDTYLLDTINPTKFSPTRHSPNKIF